MSARQQANSVYLYWVLVIALLILAALIVKNYLISLISAFILAYLMKPVYNRLVRTLPSWCAALLCILIVLLVILVPLGIVVTALIQQASETLADTDIHQALTEASQHPLLKQWNIDVAALRAKGISFMVSALVKMISSLPVLLLSLVVLGFSMFYMLTHWNSLAQVLIRYIPFENKMHVAAEIDITTRQIVYGTILIAILEWLAAALGFYLSGVSSYLLFATLIFLFAFIPGVGPAVVWIPAALFYLWNTQYAAAIGVIVTGIVISLGIELVVRTKVVGNRSRIHPLIMLLGIIGGISLFGIFGFIIGPLVLAYALRLLDEGLKNTPTTTIHK